MHVALRCGLAAKLLPPAGTTAKELCKILPERNVNKIQVAGLTRAKYRDESEVPNVKPFPYDKRPYGWLDHLVFDQFNENRVHKHCKLIVVEGPIAAGKVKFAKKLAEEMDYLFLPQPTFDELYISPWGFDMRTFDHKLPKGAQSWDYERFCQDPFDRLSGMMQMYSFMLRQKTYIHALRHIFCTGQGVVTVRSPWSDSVFAKAMYQNKYINRRTYYALKDQWNCSLPNYLRPHLLIYLDVPVDKTMENIKKNGEQFEKNAKALNQKYLTDVENAYKRELLPYMDDYSLLLCYDWSQEADFELILEDIENVDFERYSNHITKLADWVLERGIQRYYARVYSSNEDILLRNMEITRFDVPELCCTGEENKAFADLYLEHPDFKYNKGYNPLKGEKNLLFKYGGYHSEDYVTPLMNKYYERKKKEENMK